MANERKDYAEAVRWYGLAANQGNAAAQNNLAQMYAHGKGVAEDQREAARLFRLAAERGIAPAQRNLGRGYEIGLGGLPKDRNEALRWYGLAAKQGDPEAKARMRSLAAAP
jgi:uncharacterized protein